MQCLSSKCRVNLHVVIVEYKSGYVNSHVSQTLYPRLTKTRDKRILSDESTKTDMPASKQQCGGFYEITDEDFANIAAGQQEWNSTDQPKDTQ